MKRYSFLIAFLFLGTVLTTGSFAQSATPNNVMPHPTPAIPPVSGGAPKVDPVQAAMDQCAKSVAKDANGEPNAVAFEACMKNKGLDKPKDDAPPSPPPPPPTDAPL